MPRSDRPDRSYVLALGFGTSVAMWGLGFLLRMPGELVPAGLLGALLLAAQLAGGWIAGRTTGEGMVAGIRVGMVSACINLLVLGSLLTQAGPNRVVPSALLWLPGSLVLGVVLGGLGGLLARVGVPTEAARPHAAGPDAVRQDAARPEVAHPSAWTERFAWVAVAATLFLLAVGGLVTSHQAGLAVVDWPNSFGYNMFLFPLSRMTGGVYYEHSHRLFGALVGMTTVVLAIHLAKVESRRWLKRLAVGAVFMVIVQGILGGLRVTGRFTTSTSPADTSPSLTLALIHGVFGQVFFATLVAIAVFSSRAWREAPPAEPRVSAALDRRLTRVLVGVLVVQLVLGAVLRHTSGALAFHLGMAAVVIAFGLVASIRARELYAGLGLLPRLGRSLQIVLGAQLVLGIGALVAVAFSKNTATPPLYDVITTTLHQITGAVLLANAVMLMLWTERSVRPATAVTGEAVDATGTQGAGSRIAR